MPAPISTARRKLFLVFSKDADELARGASTAHARNPRLDDSAVIAGMRRSCEIHLVSSRVPIMPMGPMPWFLSTVYSCESRAQLASS